MSEGKETALATGQQNANENSKNTNFPVSNQFTVLEGYDIYRSSKLIVALVVVESNFGKDLRMYRWQLRNDTWKVDLCRMSVADWKWEEISAKAREFTQKYGINRRSGRSDSSE